MKKVSKKLGGGRGFTLAELLIVIAIIAILIAIAVPVFSTSMRRAQKATDDANFRAAKSAAINALLTGVIDIEAADGSVANEELDWSKVNTGGAWYLFTTNGNWAAFNGSGAYAAEPVTAKLTAEADKDPDYLIGAGLSTGWERYHVQGAQLWFNLSNADAGHTVDESEATTDFYRLYDGEGHCIILAWRKM